MVRWLLLVGLYVVLAAPASAAEQVIKEGGTGVIHTGEGDVNIGYTFEQHEKALRERDRSIRIDLEKIYQNKSDNLLLEKQLSDIKKQQLEKELSDIEKQFQNQTKSDQKQAQQERALNMIGDFADRLCNKIPLGGSAEDLELSGKAKVEFSNLLKKIADLGIEGSAKYQKKEFEGVLQKDLAALVKDNAKCKLEVFKDLKDILIVDPKHTQFEPVTVHGTVSLEGGGRLKDASIFLSDGIHAYSTVTDSDGYYQQLIQLSDSLWRLKISHRATIDDDRFIQIPIKGGALEPSIIDFKDKFKKPVLQFFVDKPTVGLKNSNESIWLRGIMRTGTTRSSVEVEWDTCETKWECTRAYNPNSCWFDIDYKEDKVDQDGIEIVLSLKDSYENTIKCEDQSVDLTFRAKSVLSNDKRYKDFKSSYSTVSVFPNEEPVDAPYIQAGFLQIKGGGWPGNDGVIINAYLERNGKIVGGPINHPPDVIVDENGHFSIRIPRSQISKDRKNNNDDDGDKVRLRVEPGQYSVTKSANDAIYIRDIEIPRTRFISVVPN